MTEHRADVIVIGAGIVGAMCAFFTTKAGLKTIVIDRGAIVYGIQSRVGCAAPCCCWSLLFHVH